MVVELSPPHEPELAHALPPLAAGALAGGVLAIHASAAAVAAAAGALALALALRAWGAGRIRVGSAAFAAGLALAAAVAPLRERALPPDHLARRAGPGITAVEGVVVASEPRARGVGLVLRAERARTARGETPARGLLGVTVAHPRRSWPAGARVRLVGRLRLPRNFGNPGGYDYARALARRGIRVTAFLWDDERLTLLAPPAGGWTAALGARRAALEARLARVAEPPVRGYLAAVLLGAGGAVDRETRAVLARTGLAHVASVSGFHVAVLAAAAILAIRGALRRCERALVAGAAVRLAAVGGVVPVLLYAGIAGGRVPATRALLMYACLVGAQLLDRPGDGLRALAAAALVLALGVPDVAADASFQLSFAAVAAIVLAARRLGIGSGGAPAARRLAGVGASGAEGAAHGSGARLRSVYRRLVLEPFLVSLAASLATAPLTAWHFQVVSLISPVANLLALPLLGPATLLPGLAALPLAGIAPGLADALLGVAAGAATLGLALAAALARLPGAAAATPMPSFLELALLYGALGLPLAAGLGARARRALAAALAVAALADTGYWIWERHGNPALRVTFLSVGQGDAAVIELPRGGGVLVVDGGGLPGDFDPGERLVAPFLRARKIMRVETLVLSHPDLDHYEGLAYLAERFRARELWSNGTGSRAQAFARLEAALARAGTRRVVLARGAVPLERDGVRIDVLHPARTAGVAPNDASLVLRLAHGAVSILFTGDVERAAEAELAAAALPLGSTVLKVPHHGSATSSSPGLLAAVAPRVAVISAGHENRFGHPAPAVLARLAAAGAAIWRTDRDGAVRVVSDGARLAVTAARRRHQPRTGRDSRGQPRRDSTRPGFEFPGPLW